MSYICVCKDASPNHRHPGVGSHQAWSEGPDRDTNHMPLGKVVVALGYSATLSKMDPFLHVGIMPFVLQKKKKKILAETVVLIVLWTLFKYLLNVILRDLFIHSKLHARKGLS